MALFIPESSGYNIWVHDIARDTLTRLTFEKRFDFSVVGQFASEALTPAHSRACRLSANARI